MIDQSFPWKRDLLATAGNLDKLSQRRRPSEKLLFELEKMVFMGAYSMRKLMEAKLISTDTETLPILACSFSAKNKPVTFYNWHRIDKLYDLGSPCQASLPLSFVCNQLIHSYVFMPVTSSMTGPVKEILFTSDRKRNKKLYGISLFEFSKALKVVGEDYPTCRRMEFDEKLGDYKIINWTPSP